MNLTLEQGRSVRRPPAEEEGAAETKCDELTITPFPHPPVPLGGSRRERNGMEVEPMEEGRCGGEGVLGPGFISHYPALV